MLENLVGTISEDKLNLIIADALEWLIDKFGDNSIELNKVNYTRKHSAIRPFVFKHQLTYAWSYNPKALDWHYYGQWAEYRSADNRICLHCNKKSTLQFVLECLFHEYQHSQQSMFRYAYPTISYINHPLEKEANDFAAEVVPLFWKDYEKKLLG
jgi:hypothetical protein